MIELKELRQGNLIKYIGKGTALQLLTVVEIRRDSIITLDKNGLIFGTFPGDVEGIRLTGESLETLKFQPRPHLGDHFLKLNYKADIVIVRRNGITKIATADGESLRIKDTKYLHQLQNLFFDLTGEWLEIDIKNL
jgi:hypothetical protein